MFKTDGVFRLVSLPSIPTLKATVSAKANVGIWQLAQLTEESLDNIFSENNFLPRPAFVLISVLFVSKEKPNKRKIQQIKMQEIINFML